MHTVVTVSGHNIGIELRNTGTEVIRYDGVEVSRRRSFFGTTHAFVVDSAGSPVSFEVRTRPAWHGMSAVATIQIGGTLVTTASLSVSRTARTIGAFAALLLLALSMYGGLRWAQRDLGRITVVLRDSPNPAHQYIRGILAANRSFEILADGTEALFDIPRALTVVARDCGSANASYDPSTQSISICYELVSGIIADLRRSVRSDSILATASWQATMFIYFHEVGHALVHMHALPITGREEDAVDQLATLTMLRIGSSDALWGARWFAERARPTFWGRLLGQDRGPLWDEHSLNEQRYFNVMCWAYGSDPAKYNFLLRSEWGLPAARARRCPSEYAQTSQAWSRLLAR